MKKDITMRGILIVAKQRAGTNFLRGLLSAAGPVRNFGEVFQPISERSLWKYDTWLEDNPQEAIAAESYAASIQHSDRFLKHLEGIDKGKQAPCVDVKYNSLLRTAGVWYSPADLPPILAAAAKRKYHVIHLQRRNRLEQAVSTMVASETGLYIAKDSTKIDQKKINLEPSGIIKVARKYDREAAMCDFWLDNATDRFGKLSIQRLNYEDLTGADQETLTDIITGILDTCDIPMEGEVKPKTKKIISDWREKVSNAEEIETAYADYTERLHEIQVQG